MTDTRALNEGRGFHPGDTRKSPPACWARIVAQRRPGLPPRRHAPLLIRVLPPRQPRSTKAGASTPATRGSSGGSTSETTHAQRRPGLPPRRHVSRPQDDRLDAAARSTKAGASTPASRRGRGYGIAQRRPGLPPRRHESGRDQVGSCSHCPRSTKAGASTPATPGPRSRSGHELQRSTKAGASTPATHIPCDSSSAIESALNEGRGFHPGDTANPAMAA